MAPVNVKIVHQTSLLNIESNPDRLGLLSSNHGQYSQQLSRQITLQSGFIRPKFIKTSVYTRLAEISKIVVSRSMAVEALNR